MKRIIDISHHNEMADFMRLNKENIDGVMIRIMSGTRKDKKADEHVRKCVENGIPFGFYIYSYALNRKEVKKELEMMHTFANELCIKYQVYPQLPFGFDMEDADSYKKKNHALGVDNILNILYTVRDYFVDEKLPFMVYMSYDWWTRQYMDALEIFTMEHRWVARWTTNSAVGSDGYIAEKRMNPGIDCLMWQYTSKEPFNNTTETMIRLDCNRALDSVFYKQEE